MNTRTNQIILASVVLALAAIPAGADTTMSFDASVQGIFTSYGQNNKGYNAGPGNILVGTDGSTGFRNYFVFNFPPNLLPAGMQVTSATLTGKMPYRGVLSVDPTETWGLFDVSLSSYAVLIDENTPVVWKTGIYDDLGTGNQYGSRVVDESECPYPGPTPIIVNLGTSFLTDINARLSAPGAQPFIVGGALTSIVGNGAQRLFGFSGYDPVYSGRSTLSLTIGTLAAACPGDLNADGQVDDLDFVFFASAYNILDCADTSMPAGCPSDLNADSFVDDSDFVVFAAAYDALVCP
ncbi:MAG: hypothetical protein ACREJD_07730 [Phycisphaerales bacterium]